MKSLLQALTNGQKLSIVAILLLIGGGIYAFVHWSTEKDFKPLYHGLAAEDAGAVIAHLKEGGVEYRVDENGSTILVRSGKVAESRLQMAALGIPKTGRIGFELFDKNNFGVTDFTEQVNYHRALEGELERSVTSLAEVESARVHLTFPKNSVFLDNRQDAKASVMVKLRSGGRISNQNVLAICHLVSSAVEGLRPESVSVLDMQGNLLSRPRRPLSEDGQDISDAALDYRQRLEKDLLAKINSTLEPILGADKFRAGASVDCDFSAGEQSEETFDPNKSVMVTSQKTEDISGGSSAGGMPGAASNLPRPTSRPASTGTGVTRRTENVTYQTSRTVRRVHLPQGTVRKISVSVLVDNKVRWEGSGPKAKRVVEPRTAEEIKVIHDLVAGVAGLDTSRGDQLIVESLPFEVTQVMESPQQSLPATPAAPSKTPQKDWRDLNLTNWKPLAIGAGGAVLLVAGSLFALMRKRKKRARIEQVRQLAAGEDPSAAIRKQLEDRAAEQQAAKERQELETLASFKTPPAKTQKAEVLSKQLSAESKKDPMAIAHILRTWLSER